MTPVSGINQLGSFLQGAGVLASGSAIAQAILLLGMPVLTRIYSPDQFAVLATYTAIVSVLTVIASLRYNIAIAIPDDDADALDLLRASIFFAAITSSSVFVLTGAFEAELIVFLKAPALDGYLWLVPLGMFAAACYEALQNFMVRMGRFYYLVLTRIGRATISVSLQIFMGIQGIAPLGLLLGYVALFVSGALGLVAQIWSKNGSGNKLNLKKIYQMVKRYKVYPALSAPEACLNTLASEVPIILVVIFADAKEAGFLFLALRIVGLPMTFIGTAIGHAYISEARIKLQDGGLQVFTKNTLKILVAAGVPIFTIFAASAPLLSDLVFGAEWSRAGYLVAWLAPAFLLQFLCSPISMILPLLDQHRLALALQLSGCGLRIGLVLASGYLYPALAAEAFAASAMLFYAFYLLVILRLIK